jgi:hypothetical protein
MKKLIIPAMFAFVAAIMVSCQKESLQQPNCPIITTTKIIAGDWLSLSFTPITSTPTTRNLVFLLGNYTITSPVSYDPAQNVQLVYAKIPGSNGYSYLQLPGLFSTPGQNIAILFELNPVTFTVKIWDAVDGSKMPDVSPVQSFQFRYLVVPQTVYQSLHINWSNYPEVATALNLSL